MNKREITLFGIGFLVGYVVIRLTKVNLVLNSSDSKNLPNTLSKTIPPKMSEIAKENTQEQNSKAIETSDNPKIEFCKEKWSKFSKTKRFGSEEQMQSTYDNFMSTCVGQL